MGKLIYSMITSLDGYVSDSDGGFAWSVPDEELHEFINHTARSIGTALYGRRMYEVMSYWETAHLEPDQPPVFLEFARNWQSTEKFVYSTTLDEVSSKRTSIARSFDPDMVRKLKSNTNLDMSVNGPNLAAQAIRAGLVDEYQLFIAPAVVGGGNRFFPDGVCIDLELQDEQRFGNSVVYLRYREKDNAEAL